MKFYTVTKNGSEGQNVCVVDDQAEQLYLYVPNFETFHRDQQLEDEFYFPDPVDGSSVVFQEITAAEAGQVIPTLKGFDSRYEVQRRLLNEYRAQLNSTGEALTIAEAGVVSTSHLPRATKSEGLHQLLVTRAKRRAWTTLSLYGPKNGDSSPREAARKAKENRTLKKLAQDNGQVLTVKSVKTERSFTAVRIRLQKEQAMAYHSTLKDLAKAS